MNRKNFISSIVPLSASLGAFNKEAFLNNDFLEGDTAKKVIIPPTTGFISV